MTGGAREEGVPPASPEASRYLFPRHPREVCRLDLQHHALREALGRNYFAPLERPARILDLGTGSGRWCLDMSAEFPEAHVVGLDVVFSEPVRGPRLGLVRGDVTAGLPFLPRTFDFVHQRLLRSGIPVVAWPDTILDLVRVTRPGGWVELVEIGEGLVHEGPATLELRDRLNRLAAMRGLDSDGRVVTGLERLLARSGLEGVTTHRAEVPVGEWGGRPGSFMASDMRSMFTRLAPAFEARLSVPPERTHELIRRAMSECEELHSSAVLLCAWGRRPA